jgi:formiminoglutamase
VTPDWLEVRRGEAPLVIGMPHTGTHLPPEVEAGLRSTWLACRDADWWIQDLYRFAGALGATVVRTRISRTVIDANRDPSGQSLYPGQATTELCPTTTFDGEPLYEPGAEPGEAEIARRRDLYFTPYHDALTAEIARLRAVHPAVVLYDAHSIRSTIPRLFEGVLPNFNIGTNGGATCAPALTATVEAACDRPDFTRVTDGRFRGGYTTRHYGQPETGVHAIQMELACRGYMVEPEGEPAPGAWPTPFDAARAEPMRAILREVLSNCIAFAASQA